MDFYVDYLFRSFDWLFRKSPRNGYIFKKINIFKIEKNLKKLLPDIRSYKQYYILILSIGIPHCCWSVGRYIISNPLGFAFKNIIFYFDIAYKSLIN